MSLVLTPPLEAQYEIGYQYKNASNPGFFENTLVNVSRRSRSAYWDLVYRVFQHLHNNYYRETIDSMSDDERGFFELGRRVLSELIAGISASPSDRKIRETDLSMKPSGYFERSVIKTDFNTDFVIKNHDNFRFFLAKMRQKCNGRIYSIDSKLVGNSVVITTLARYDGYVLNTEITFLSTRGNELGSNCILYFDLFNFLWDGAIGDLLDENLKVYGINTSWRNRTANISYNEDNIDISYSDFMSYVFHRQVTKYMQVINPERDTITIFRDPGLTEEFLKQVLVSVNGDILVSYFNQNPQSPLKNLLLSNPQFLGTPSENLAYSGAPSVSPERINTILFLPMATKLASAPEALIEAHRKKILEKLPSLIGQMKAIDKGIDFSKVLLDRLPLELSSREEVTGKLLRKFLGQFNSEKAAFMLPKSALVDNFAQFLAEHA